MPPAAAPTLSAGPQLQRHPDGTVTVTDYAYRFDMLAQPYGTSFYEQIVPGAATASIAAGTVRALRNHDPDQVLGTQGDGTLRLAEDTEGLRYELDLPDTILGHQVVALIDNRDLRGSSFGFRSRDTRWGQHADRSLRTIRRLELIEVSLVRRPVSQRRFDPDAPSSFRAVPRYPSLVPRPGRITGLTA